MSEMMIYWWTRLDSIQGVFVGFLVAGGIATFLWIAGNFALADKNYYKSERAIFEKFWFVPWICVIGLVGTMFIPSSKEFAMMKVIPKLVNSEVSQQIQKDIPEVYKIAKDALLEKITPKK